jgi:hypothetical protein
MSCAAVFVYDVDDEAADAFESEYGPDGGWARFFRRSDAYLGTELWCSSDEGPRRYLVIDRWQSAVAYDAFLSAQEGEYRSRSQAAEPLYRREQFVGRFDAVPTRTEDLA